MPGQTFSLAHVDYKRRLHLVVLGPIRNPKTLCGRTTRRPQIGAYLFSREKLAALRDDPGVYCQECVDQAAILAGFTQVI